jgi:hypothetical protein
MFVASPVPPSLPPRAPEERHVLGFHGHDMPPLRGLEKRRSSFMFHYKYVAPPELFLGIFFNSTTLSGSVKEALEAFIEECERMGTLDPELIIVN